MSGGRSFARARLGWPDLDDAAVGLAPDAARAGYAYIEETWRRAGGAFPCWTSGDRAFGTRSEVDPEIFTAAIVLDLLGPSPLDELVKREIVALLRRKRTPAGLHHFFVDEGKLPADADCTAIAHAALLRAGALPVGSARATADRLLANRDPRGILAVYFVEPGSDRAGLVDVAVWANALELVTSVRPAEDDAAPTVAFLEETLASGAYLAGTRYYPYPDAFLFFAARLVHAHRARFLRLWALLRRDLARRCGTPGTPLELAFRAIAAGWVGLPARVERTALRILQGSDGAWPAGAFFRYGRTERYFGSEVLTTAFCLRALGT